MVVVPAVNPVTTPDAFTVALATFDEDQEPPVPVFVSEIVFPVHTALAPDIVPGTGASPTDITPVVLQPPAA